VSTDHTERGLRFLSAWEKGDKQTMASLVTDDFTWTLPGPSAAQSMAGDAALTFLASVGETTMEPGTLNIKPVRTVHDDSQVVFEANVTGKTVGGKDYDNWYVIWFEFRDGKITRIREHTDTAYAFAVMAPEA